jgi:hypothetical protein
VHQPPHVTEPVRADIRRIGDDDIERLPAQALEQITSKHPDRHPPQPRVDACGEDGASTVIDREHLTGTATRGRQRQYARTGTDVQHLRTDTRVAEGLGQQPRVRLRPIDTR